MSRLVDYFIVCGYDPTGRAGAGQNETPARVIQRFPEKDWPDVPFIHGIHLFCQPDGWLLSSERQDPKFFISVLTNVEGNRLYCPCLTFSEPVPKNDLESKAPDEEIEDGLDNPAMSLVTLRGSSLPRYALPGRSYSKDDSVMYSPKCLALVSKFDIPDFFRNCLGLIYTAHVEQMVGASGEAIRLETIVGNLLGSLAMPDPCAGPLKFSLGASDRQVIHSPIYPDVPSTGTRVALLFHQLGIRNVLSLFSAVLTEQKILFYSQSYSRLTDSCTGLTSLIYPMRYSHTLVPILPSSILEVLSSPTPYIIGVHSSHQEHIADLLDVITVDLDGGCISIPQNMTVLEVMEPLRSRAIYELSLVLKPELEIADNAFNKNQRHARSEEIVDKELRAVFLRLMAQLLQGYRSCLTLVRIHPLPYITFHKAAFLGMRNLSQDCAFISRFLECMFFSDFISSRGPPWRKCDIFDDVYAQIGEQLAVEAIDHKKVVSHIERLASELYANENPVSPTGSSPDGNSLRQRIPLPTEMHMARVQQPPFPILNGGLIQRMIQEGEILRQTIKTDANPSSSQHNNSSQPQLVPMGQRLDLSVGSLNPPLLTNSARRLNVLRNCISHIFENKISDAKKTFPAVLRTLKSKDARLALCEELASHVSGNQAMLEHQQFDLIVRLMNAALQDDSDIDMHGVAAALMPLSQSFCRKLAPGVIQFVYTLIQDHAVWQNLQFWEAAFYCDVQKGIKDLYLAIHDSSPRDVVSAQPPIEKNRAGSRVKEVRKSALFNPETPSVLEIAASEMKKVASLDEDTREELRVREEQTVKSQAIHYTSRMVSLLISMDFKPERNNKSLADHTSDLVSNSISNSVAESDSIDAESGFDDTEPNDNGTNVTKFILRFVDKVCGMSSISESHIRTLHQQVPDMVAMHLETMEAVTKEAKRLPPIQKPKLHNPTLLAGEQFLCPGLRVYLWIDGRDEHYGMFSCGPPLLPAEGGLFLTNYRVIFKGNPLDPYANELSVMRAFPVTSITREKKVTLHEYVSEIDQMLKEGIQLRSNTFQLIRAAFDDEVTPEDIESFKKLIHKVQNPPTLWHFFAFRNHITLATDQLAKDKDKNAKYSTIRGFAKTTLKNVSKATGIKTKGKKGSKYTLPNHMLPPMHGRLSFAEYMNHEGRLREEDEHSEVSDQSTASPGLHLIKQQNSLDMKGLERLSENLYYKDWERLGLGKLDPSVLKSSGSSYSQESTRVTVVNHKFSLTRTYPQLMVIPGKITDDSLRRICRLHRQSRFPVITWRQLSSHALLLRGASYHARGVLDILKRHQQDPQTNTPHEANPSVEADEYLRAVIAGMPDMGRTRSEVNWNLSESTSSLTNGLDGMLGGMVTPTLSRRANNPFSRAIDGFGTLTRSSGGKGGRSFGGRLSLSNMKGRPGLGSETSLTGSGAYRGSFKHTDSDSEHGYHPLARAALYVFVDKAQIKGVKVDHSQRLDFVPVEFPEPRKLKASFKKLLRACHPSTLSQGSNADEQSFLKMLENSDWFSLMQSVMQIAGAVTDLIDSDGSSVMLCLEDGWDITCQISSIAQLCLDPYYRTIKGFRVLIEKEWMAFGHRFNLRSNLNATSQDSGFTPVFLQFLDIVHQIHHQFPTAFEFSQYYLSFLAYHHVSCRFRTFLLDSEFERHEVGLNSCQDTRRSSLPRTNLVNSRPSELGHSSDEEDRPASGHTGHLGISVFDYIDEAHSRSPLFYNSLYCPELLQSVLFPKSSMANLKLWDYYIREELRHGPQFDLEYVQLDEDREELKLAVDNHASPTRSTLTRGYDCMVEKHLDATAKLLKDIERLEAELGLPPQRWQHHWDELEPPPAHPPPPPPQAHAAQRHRVLTPTLYSSEPGRTAQRRSTVELLLRGKTGANGSEGAGVSGPGSQAVAGGQVYSHPHRFEKFNYSAPTYCDMCNSVLWGFVRIGYRCQDCGLNCHEKCRDQVTKACTKYKSVQRDSHTDDIGNGGLGGLADHAGFYNYRDRQGEATNIIYQGYLYKRGGALLKGWKQRWFVLDSIKHQLRYYDTREDLQCKGTIDLSEVRGVSEGSAVPGAPKKAEEKCFFDLQTSKRNYSLCAENRQQALEWQEKIQSCL